MSFPQVVSEVGSLVSSDNTSHAITLPAGVQAGDLLLAVQAVDSNPTVTLAAGWTPLHNAASGAAVSLVVASRIADGSEGSSVVFTTSAAEQSAARALRLTGHHATTPAVASAGVAGGGGATQHDPDALDPAAWDAEDVLWLAVLGYNVGTFTIASYPASYSNGTTDRTNSAGGVGVGVARRELNAASEDPGVFTLSSATAARAATVAVRPTGVVAAPSLGEGGGDGATAAHRISVATYTQA